MVAPVSNEQHLAFEFDQVGIAVVLVGGVASQTLLVFRKILVVHMPVKCISNPHRVEWAVLPAAGGQGL